VWSTRGTLYVATTLGVRGVSGNSGGAVLDPNAPKVGLYKSTTRADLHAGLRRQHLRSADTAGASTTQSSDSHGDLYIAPKPRHPYRSKERRLDMGARVRGAGARRQRPSTEFALNTVNPGNHTRSMSRRRRSVSESDADGASFLSHPACIEATTSTRRPRLADRRHGTNPRLDVADGHSDRTKPDYLTYDYCWAQCSYDNAVVPPAGNSRPGLRARRVQHDFPLRKQRAHRPAVNGRRQALVRQTKDLPTAAGEQNGIHPDQHATRRQPSNPLQFFEAPTVESYARAEAR